jgi:long-chain acyl-CoA synthetase
VGRDDTGGSRPCKQKVYPSLNQRENAILAAWNGTLARGEAAAIRAADGAVLRTFAEIERDAGVWEERFAAMPERSVVALQIGNHPAWPALVLALFRRRLVPLPLGRHIEETELRLALSTCGAGAVVFLENGDLQVRSESAPVPDWGTEPPDLLKLTSGTTSAPRAVRFRANQLLADCENICDTMGFGPDDLNYGVIPVSHSYGFSNLLTPLLCRGVPMVLTDDRLPRAIVNGLAATGATVFPGMPVFFDKLAGLGPSSPLPRLRLCISAGAALSPAVATAFSARFGGLKIHTFYGSSECGGIGYDATDTLSYSEGFVGRPMRGVEISPEPAGRIVVRGAAVGDGYFPEEDPDTLGGGRFIPGDLIEWREEGMFLAGRASDLINIAGRKLNPAEVESHLMTFPGVRQAIVFGVPSRLRGEEPVACVAGDSLDRAKLLRHCHERLSQWQMPREFWLVDEIAANERGKISRRALAERYLAEKA